MGLDDLSLLIDEVRDPAGRDIPRRIACSVEKSDSSIGIADQTKRKIVFLSKPAVGFRCVEAGAENFGVSGQEVLVKGPEPGPLFRSTRCVGLGKEPEDDFFSSEVGKAHRLAVMIDGGEIGCLGSLLQHRKRPPQ